ncbi:T9SS type A sorting domain-containing protein [Mesoflavibacter zeaxanthinifaciens]|uniref:T9SS type A sorting domain-containing protein n=1 Tax=Mesoflavibacter zeaxanthinifaciens TaxID=393060 RepID=UPI0026ED979A|nr:T9SS type A sorting domain-containing protein [Mesoflavibacter zeaxanthinifaciens]
MKKITYLLSFFALVFSTQTIAQYSCSSGVVITDGYTATGITSPGTGGAEDWNDNPTVECGGTSAFYWDDDVYLFTYTAGATDEEISMTTFSRNSWNGLGIFTTCTGTALDGCLDTAGTTGTDATKTVTANISAGQTVYIAVGQWGSPNDLDFDVTAFSAIPLVNPPSCTTLSSPLNGVTDASISGDISWNAASGAATDYLLQVGTTSGGSEVFSGQVGNVTTYNVGALSESTTYYVTITPSNSNGVATGCAEESFTTLTPLPGDFISNPIAILPSEEGIACNTTEYPFSFDFQSGYTDSGLDDTCTNANTGLDIFFSWTATSDALIWNDGGGNPGIAIRDAVTGNVITCVTTYAAVDYVLSGWSIGDDLILQVYDYGTTSVNPLSFCLAEYNLPSVPECTSNYVSTPDATCGSLDTTISWDAGVDTDGYYLTVGTTSGGNDILDNVDIGNVTTYDVGNQTESTTYYWSLTPYNVTGSAEGCTENTYTTIAAQCYCTSTTTSIDGSGISSLQVGTTDFNSGGTLSYEDFTGVPVDLAAGINSNVQITFATGYSYGVNIWIDFNDDYVFDSSELLFTGEETTGVNPTTYDASFLMPAAAALGTHRMRIVTDDTNADAADPCNSTTWHVTMDVDVNIIEASCSPAVATATVAPDCGNSQFFIDVDVTDLGNGTPVIDDGTNTYPVSAIGVVQVGPYASGSSVTLVITHGTDSSCDISLGTVSYTCPPSNDDIANATAITIGEMICDGSTNNGSNVAATDSGEGAGTCFFGGAGSDVWYTFTISSDSDVTVSTDYLGGTLVDTQIAVYSGTPGALVEEGCSQDEGTVILSNGSSWNSIISDLTLTAGTYYVQVSGYDGAEGTFCLSVDAVSLSTEDFNQEVAFTYYPNPVNNNLNLSSQKEINNVSVYNMVGQEVYRSTPNTMTDVVDMSGLQAGAYFVKVTVGNATKTVKVIKK